MKSCAGGAECTNQSDDLLCLTSDAATMALLRHGAAGIKRLTNHAIALACTHTLLWSFCRAKNSHQWTPVPDAVGLCGLWHARTAASGHFK